MSNGLVGDGSPQSVKNVYHCAKGRTSNADGSLVEQWSFCVILSTMRRSQFFCQFSSVLIHLCPVIVMCSSHIAPPVVLRSSARRFKTLCFLGMGSQCLNLGFWTSLTGIQRPCSSGVHMILCQVCVERAVLSSRYGALCYRRIRCSVNNPCITFACYLWLSHSRPLRMYRRGRHRNVATWRSTWRADAVFRLDQSTLSLSQLVSRGPLTDVRITQRGRLRCMLSGTPRANVYSVQSLGTSSQRAGPKDSVVPAKTPANIRITTNIGTALRHVLVVTY